MRNPAPGPHELKYRPDIDGLRAVAVLAVVIFHAYPTMLAGGFLGVDIFFVISGFLISKIILDEVDGNRFSLVTFYERRIRRITPALFVMLFASIALAMLFMYPSTLRDAANSLFFAVFSLSNIYFMFTTDYFGTANDDKPLLHTWSLGVEEQFYIFFPLIILLIARFVPKYRLQILLGLAAISLALSLFGAVSFPITTFYGPQTRAYELLCGTFLASGVIKPPKSQIWAQIIAAAGFLLTAISILAFGHITSVPAVGSVIAVAGASLIIFSGTGNKTWLTWLLSLTPVVFVGRISYSLYLWHWPVLKQLYWPVANLLSHFGATAGLKTGVINVALLVLAFGIAYLSWKYVEQPFRNKALIARKPLFTGAAIISGLLALVTLSSVVTGGWPQRFSPAVVTTASYVDYVPAQFHEGTCFLTHKYGFTDYKAATCLQKDAGKPNILLVGDSHAAHLWYGLSQSLDAHIMQANASGCKPVLAQPVNANVACRQLIEYIYQNYLMKNKVDLVVISARWRPEDVADLAKTLGFLKSHNVPVAVLGPIAEYQYPLPYILASAMRDNDPQLPERLRVKSAASVDAAMAKMTAGLNVPYGSVYNVICPQAACQTRAPDGTPMQFDYGHLTAAGSLTVGKGLANTGIFTPYLAAPAHP